MARVKFGSLVVGVRGKVGGLVFTAGSAGAYCKPWASVANKRSVGQVTRRTSLSAAPQAWRALSGAQRAAWASWAADPAQARVNSLGVTYYLNAFQAFNSCYLRAAAAVLTPLSDPPVGSVPSMPTIVDLVFGAVATVPTCTVELDGAEFDPTDRAVIEAVALVGSARQVQYAGFVQVFNAAVPGGDIVDITAPLTARFGAFGEGWQVFVRVARETDEYQRSAPAQADAFYAP